MTDELIERQGLVHRQRERRAIDRACFAVILLRELHEVQNGKGIAYGIVIFGWRLRVDFVD